MSTLLISRDDSDIDFTATEKLHFDFDENVESLDEYITSSIIPKIIDFNILIIDIALSENLLDFYGLNLVHHIRLSSKLKDTRFVPIVLISDFDGCLINNKTTKARVVFTKNVYLVENTEEKIEEKLIEISTNNKTLELQNNFLQEFIEKIVIDEPSSSHNIANEWSIYKWANSLSHEKKTIMEIADVKTDKIESMLYFKYLDNLYSMNSYTECEVKSLKDSGSILYIDDEWDKGWSNILELLLSKSDDVFFKTFEYNYKEKNDFGVLTDVKNKVLDEDPDLVILDLRLTETDHNPSCLDINMLSGIKLVEIIKKINKGIQIIMLTATSQSMILERLYDGGVLGYIKKEHPNDMSIDSTENINKLYGLLTKGLRNKYLKDIWQIQNELLNLIILKEAKLSFTENTEILELKNTISMIFDILNSDMLNKLVFAALTIFKCIEIIIDMYIKEESYREGKNWINNMYWKDTNRKLAIVDSSVELKIKEIMSEKLNINDYSMIYEVKRIVCFRNYNIHSGKIKERCSEVLSKNKKPTENDIVDWFNLLKNIVVPMNTLYKNP